MKKRKLSQRGEITIAVLVFMVCLVILSLFPNTDNHEVRTMRVHEVVGEVTYLIDGNNEIYGMYDKVYDEHADLYVTIDNKGTSNLRDDVIISWIYKN